MDIVKEYISDKFNIIRLDIQNVEHFLHWHSRHEMCYIIDGECKVYVNGVEYIARKGDILVLKSGDIHRYVSSGGDCTTYITTFDPTLVYMYDLKGFCVKSYINRDELVEKGIYDDINYAFNKMYNEIREKEKNHEVIVKTLITNIFCLLGRYFEDEKLREFKDINKFEKFQRALDYLNENYANNVTLEDISKVLNYSVSNIPLMFDKFIGMNFKKYLDTIRIQKSIQMLNNSDESITVIAMQCGFNNIRTFNNVFKSVTGMTPTEMRGKS